MTHCRNTAAYTGTRKTTAAAFSLIDHGLAIPHRVNVTPFFSGLGCLTPCFIV
jgi:hypothetical protein